MSVLRTVKALLFRALSPNGIQAKQDKRHAVSGNGLCLSVGKSKLAGVPAQNKHI